MDVKYNFSPNTKIIDLISKKIKGVGKVHHGLYYLTATPALNPLASNTNHLTFLTSSANHETFSLWHHRLGHAPLTKLRHIPHIQAHLTNTNELCLTCPMAKFTKQPFETTTSHSQDLFELIHIDIWGPYKVCTRKKYKYFLTIVDDHSRNTWVYLIQHKSDSLLTLETFLNYAQNHFNKTSEVPKI